MTQPRDRIPASDAYLRALGRASYNFAYLEWGVVWLTETIDQGFLGQVSSLTAGQIARRFSDAVGTLNDGDDDKAAMLALAAVFTDLVEDRNRLMHGNPFTAQGGEQRLLYNGRHGRKDWTIDLMSEFADRLAQASIEAGRLIHGGRYQSWQAAQVT